MQLPPPLRRAIEQELAGFDPAQLRAASSRLSQCYRSPDERLPLVDDVHRAAYLAVRMPATFVAVSAALGWSRQACDEANEFRTMLDLGSGPGTALWAAAELFPTLDRATAIERDPRLIEIARRLSRHSDRDLLRHATWLRGDMMHGLGEHTQPESTWDLVVCSYALNEIAAARRAELIRQAWARTAKLLVLVEPGTRAGFANLIEVRSQLLAAGARLAAPCPHALACPMAAAGDWCHFAARLERTADHRRLKDASLGYEDEKFSYVAFSRKPSRAPVPSSSPSPVRPESLGPQNIEPESATPAPQARIVRHPRIFSGYAQLALCREGQLDSTTVTRSQKDDWRRLKRLGWGDRW